MTFSAYKDHLSPTRPYSRPGPTPQISVLVRCFNEVGALPAFWQSIRGQTAWELAEIIFLDSGSTDGSLEFLVRQPCRLYQTSPGEFQFGRSCNQLMRLATAPLAMFLSAHVLLEDQDALQRVIEFMDSERMQAAYLRQIPNSILGFSSYEAAYLRHRFPKGESASRMFVPSAFSNAASVFTRKSWQQEPFPEVHGSEDFLWAQKHLLRGNELYYLPQICALHSHNESPQEVHRRVRLNAVARGATKAYGKALFYFIGVFLQILRVGGSFAEARRYAWGHASAYFVEDDRI